MKIVKILGILAAVGLGLLVVVELVLRFAMPVEMEPPIRITLSNELPGIGTKTVTYDLNGEGLRGHQWSPKRQSNSIRILAVGAHSTSHMLQMPKDTWWGQLAQQLEAQTGKRVEVAATGSLVNSQILPGLAAAERALEGSAADVDLILVQFGLGDVLEHPANFQFDSGKLNKLRSPAKQGFGYKLAKVSQMARRLRSGRIRDSRRAQHQALSEPNYYAEMLKYRTGLYPQLPFVTKIERTDDPVKEYLAGVQGFIDLAKSKGKKLMFIGEPTLHFEFMANAESSRLLNVANVGEGENPASRVRPEWLQRELDRY